MSRMFRLPAAAGSALAAVALLAGPLAEPASAVTSSKFETDVIKYGNVERADRSKVSVKASTCLDKYAEKQAKAMAAQQRMFHQDVAKVLTACKLQLVGENVAYGFTGGKTTTTAWMNSPAHKANLIDSRHRLIGVGAAQDADGVWYVSEVLGRAA